MRDLRPDDVIVKRLPGGIVLPFEPQAFVPEGYEPVLVDTATGEVWELHSCIEDYNLPV